MGLQRIAITREVSPAIERCELTHRRRRPIDLAEARGQHAAYCGVLTELGCRVIRLPADPVHPDSVFVEDTAVVFPELAVLARPGAGSRRGEVAAIAEALTPYRRQVRIDPPGTLDGGDVITVGRRVWVGETGRTNGAGVEQLREHLAPHGYDLLVVRPSGCLHLKSAVTAAGPRHVVLNPDWVDPAAFDGLAVVEVDSGEPGAANVVQVGEHLVVAAEFPATRHRLEERGLSCRPVPASELAKAEGALTCCSLIFDA